ncbi:hypothetical protein THIX_20720 [Thiomonas sp. X19]|nr:hypothetical protein THIX_20720 [Thiomonas sp. X19]
MRKSWKRSRWRARSGLRLKAVQIALFHCACGAVPCSGKTLPGAFPTFPKIPTIRPHEPRQRIHRPRPA